MTNEEEGFRIRRILVPLDESRYSGSALKAAIQWAAQWQAELHGLFVEDVNLLKMASLPFSREISPLSPATRQLDPLSMEQTLRARAERCRRQMQEQAEQAKLNWSFRVTRGHVAAEVLSHGSQTDLVIMGRAGHSSTGAGRLGSTALSVCRQSACSVFLTGNGLEEMRPVVLYDGSTAAGRGLTLAVRMVQAEHCPLTLLLVAADEASTSELEHMAKAAVGDTTELKVVVLSDPLKALQWVERVPGALLILDAASSLWADPACSAFLTRAPYPVLLVR